MSEPVFVLTTRPPKPPSWRDMLRETFYAPHPLLAVLRLRSAVQEWDTRRRDPHGIDSLRVLLRHVAASIYDRPRLTERDGEEAAMATSGLARLWLDWHEIASQADSSIWWLWLGVDPYAPSLTDEIARLAAGWDEEVARQLCRDALTRLGWNV